MLPILRNRLVGVAPFQALWDMEREMDRMLDTVWGRNDAEQPTSWAVPADVVENENEIRCVLEVPGLKPEDVEAETDGVFVSGHFEKHVDADAVERAVPLPLVHIATATGQRIRAEGLRRVGLLGTLPTMERDFYRRRLEAMGIAVLVPDEQARRFVHGAIYGELLHGRFRPEMRAAFVDIVHQLCARGAQAVVLGCTEIPLLLRQEDSDVPLFDTLAIHAKAGVDFLLQ